MRAAKNGNLEDLYLLLRSVVSDFNRGDPSKFSDVITSLRDAHTSFLALATICNEAGVLIDANPGTLGTVLSPIGHGRTVRTWP